MESDTMFQYNNQNSIYVLNSGYSSYSEFARLSLLDPADPHLETMLSNKTPSNCHLAQQQQQENNWANVIKPKSPMPSKAQIANGKKENEKGLKTKAIIHCNENPAISSTSSAMCTPATAAALERLFQSQIQAKSPPSSSTGLAQIFSNKTNTHHSQSSNNNCGNQSLGSASASSQLHDPSAVLMLNANKFNTNTNCNGSQYQPNTNPLLNGGLISNSGTTTSATASHYINNKKKSNNLKSTLIAKKTKFGKLLEEEKLKSSSTLSPPGTSASAMAVAAAVNASLSFTTANIGCPRGVCDDNDSISGQLDAFSHELNSCSNGAYSCASCSSSSPLCGKSSGNKETPTPPSPSSSPPSATQPTMAATVPSRLPSNCSISQKNYYHQQQQQQQDQRQRMKESIEDKIEELVGLHDVNDNDDDDDDDDDDDGGEGAKGNGARGAELKNNENEFQNKTAKDEECCYNKNLPAYKQKPQDFEHKHQQHYQQQQQQQRQQQYSGLLNQQELHNKVASNWSGRNDNRNLLQQQQQKSNSELYKEAADLLGLSCTLCDNCRCLDCQSGYFDCDDSDSFSDYSFMGEYDEDIALSATNTYYLQANINDGTSYTNDYYDGIYTQNYTQSDEFNANACSDPNCCAYNEPRNGESQHNLFLNLENEYPTQNGNGNGNENGNQNDALHVCPQSETSSRHYEMPAAKAMAKCHFQGPSTEVSLAFNGAHDVVSLAEQANTSGRTLTETLPDNEQLDNLNSQQQLVSGINIASLKQA